MHLLNNESAKTGTIAEIAGWNNASGHQLASGAAMMPSGAFGGGIGESDDSSSIATCVGANFTATTIDGVTMFDLTCESAG